MKINIYINKFINVVEVSDSNILNINNLFPNTN